MYYLPLSLEVISFFGVVKIMFRDIKNTLKLLNLSQTSRHLRLILSIKESSSFAIIERKTNPLSIILLVPSNSHNAAFDFCFRLIYFFVMLSYACLLKGEAKDIKNKGAAKWLLLYQE